MVLEAVPRITYAAFVRMLPELAKTEARKKIGAEPDPIAFEENTSNWIGNCITPQRRKLADELLLKADVDPADLVRGVVKNLEDIGLYLQHFALRPHRLSQMGALEAISMSLTSTVVAYFAGIREQLEVVAKFIGSLERLDSGKYRIPPETKAKLRETLGDSLFDLDALFKEYEDQTMAGNVL